MHEAWAPARRPASLQRAWDSVLYSFCAHMNMTGVGVQMMEDPASEQRDRTAAVQIIYLAILDRPHLILAMDAQSPNNEQLS